MIWRVAAAALALSGCFPCAPIVADYHYELNRCRDTFTDDSGAKARCVAEVEHAYRPHLKMCQR